MCAYQPNIPLATDRLRTSQGDLLGNFQAAAGGLGTMLNPNQGYIQFPNQGGIPTPTGSQPGFYGSTPVLTGIEEILIAKNIIGPAFTQIPMTASILSTTAATSPANGLAGWTYLPSGILLKWECRNTPLASPSGTAITIPSGANNPPFNNLFFVIACPYGASSNPLSVVLQGVPPAPNAQTFVINVTAGPVTGFCYLAIGN